MNTGMTALEMKAGLGGPGQYTSEAYYPQPPAQTQPTWQREGETASVPAYGFSKGPPPEQRDNCFYCWNQDPAYPQPHRHRDSCPMLQQHISERVVHVNPDTRRLHLGKFGKGGAEVLLILGRPQGSQVLLKARGSPQQQQP